MSGFLTISSLNGPGTQVPISVIRVQKPGPVLALIAGVHEYEYPGITALQRLRKSIQTGDLSGTLILVHIANPPSFYGRTIYTSPADGNNLNRVFPGKENGTLSEAIAHGITQHAIAKDGLLGQLVDAFGDKIIDVRAHFAGVVNYVIATPPVNEGDPVAMISRIKEY